MAPEPEHKGDTKSKESQQGIGNEADQQQGTEMNMGEQSQNNQPQLQQQMNKQQSEPQHIGSTFQQQPQTPPANVQPAAFSSFDAPNLQPSEANNLNMLLDIPLKVTVELGRTNRSVQEILELSPGSIIELDKLAGEPVDILVNNKLIAKGEVVVIEENFGVRVTDIISQTERIKRLQ